MTDFGMRVGPFEMEDIASIDVGAWIRQHLKSSAAASADWARRQPTRRDGRYDQKTGAGWYRYESSSCTPAIDPLIEALPSETAALRGAAWREGADEEYRLARDDRSRQ